MVKLMDLTRWAQLPAELRQRRQWSVSTLAPLENGKLDKAPRNPFTGNRITVTNPLDWCTFEEAAGAGYPAIGFNLSAADPFTIIDLDDKDDLTAEERQRQIKIFEAFPSYSERSQSGKGVHIVLYGKIGGGINRDKVEIYDQDRYMICTGDVVSAQAIQSHPETLERLIFEMGGVRSHALTTIPDSEDEPCGDDDLITRMQDARNGGRFKELFSGPIDHGSDNDAALFALLTFWTKNHAQIMRIFARSVLYRPRGDADGKKGHTPESYHNKYLMETMAGAFRKQTEWSESRAADLEHGRALAAQLKPAAPPPAVVSSADFPPGLVGEVARYIYASAPRQVKEVAIAGALAFMAGICGRQFNVSSGVGLNLYLVVLADSGLGKEAAKNGVDRLFHGLSSQVPGVTSFLGPRAVSGPALEKAVSEHNPTFVTFMGEIGVRLQAMLAKRNGDPQMKAAWLGLYTAAVRNGRHQGAFHSNKENRTSDVIFPCVTIYGESNPTEYYKAISGSNFDDGFVPRFLTITTTETKIQRLNPNRAIPPSKVLLDKLAALVQYVIDLQVRDQYLEVQFAPGMSAEDIDFHYMQIANGIASGPVRTSWTRAPMQMFKVAALLAVGGNHLNPIISETEMSWARRLVESSISEVGKRQESGDLGSNETKKLPAVEEATKAYLGMGPEQRASYKIPVGLLGKPLIPYTFYRRRLSQRAEFHDDPRGMSTAIKSILQDAVDMGLLQKLTDVQKLEESGRKLPGDVYCLGPSWE